LGGSGATAASSQALAKIRRHVSKLERKDLDTRATYHATDISVIDPESVPAIPPRK